MDIVKFKSYCESQGYELLQDDLKFIEKALRYIPRHGRRSVMYEYCRQWKSGVDNEPEINRKQSAGRRQANGFLLKYKDM